MSDIETEKFRQIGIDLINEYRQQRGIRPIQVLDIRTPEINALIRSIQLHEKTKKELADCKQELADCKQELADFRQEVSDVVEQALSFGDVESLRRKGVLSRFIIPAPKPDPLVEVLAEVAADYLNDVSNEKYTNAIRAALDAAGFEIREKNDG